VLCPVQDGELPRRAALAAEVRRLFAVHRGTYGSPRTTADLQELGWKVGENTVGTLLREQGLAARARRRPKSTTRPGKGRWRAPDLVKRDFPAQKINTIWYGGGIEIKTGQGYLARSRTWPTGGRASHIANALISRP
jgi:putative transposase